MHIINVWNWRGIIVFIIVEVITMQYTQYNNESDGIKDILFYNNIIRK